MVRLLHVVLYDMQTLALIRRKLLLVSGLMADHLQRRGLSRVCVCYVCLQGLRYVCQMDVLYKVIQYILACT